MSLISVFPAFFTRMTEDREKQKKSGHARRVAGGSPHIQSKLAKEENRKELEQSEFTIKATNYFCVKYSIYNRNATNCCALGTYSTVCTVRDPWSSIANKRYLVFSRSFG